jgi:hypothetical protein
MNVETVMSSARELHARKIVLEIHLPQDQIVLLWRVDAERCRGWSIPGHQRKFARHTQVLTDNSFNQRNKMCVCVCVCRHLAAPHTILLQIVPSNLDPMWESVKFKLEGAIQVMESREFGGGYRL